MINKEKIYGMLKDLTHWEVDLTKHQLRQLLDAYKRGHGTLPFRQEHYHDAGYDISIRHGFRHALKHQDKLRLKHKADEVKRYETGLYVDIPEGTYGRLAVRSSYADTFSINGGVIDEGYCGEIIVYLKNDSSRSYVIGYDITCELVQIVFERVSPYAGDMLELEPVAVKLNVYKWYKTHKRDEMIKSTPRHCSPIHRNVATLSCGDIAILEHDGYTMTPPNQPWTTFRLQEAMQIYPSRFGVMLTNILFDTEDEDLIFNVPITNAMKTRKCPHDNSGREQCNYCDNNFLIYALFNSVELLNEENPVHDGLAGFRASYQNQRNLDPDAFNETHHLMAPLPTDNDDWVNGNRVCLKAVFPDRFKYKIARISDGATIDETPEGPAFTYFTVDGDIREANVKRSTTNIKGLTAEEREKIDSDELPQPAICTHPDHPSGGLVHEDTQYPNGRCRMHHFQDGLKKIAPCGIGETTTIADGEYIVNSTADRLALTATKLKAIGSERKETARRDIVETINANGEYAVAYKPTLTGQDGIETDPSYKRLIERSQEMERARPPTDPNYNRMMLERSHEKCKTRGDRAREMRKRAGNESPEESPGKFLGHL